MATLNHTPDVRNAQSPDEDLFALCRGDVFALGRGLEDLDDAALVALLEEAEFIQTMTP